MNETISINLFSMEKYKNQINKENFLGEGQFGKVYKFINSETQNIYAVKIWKDQNNLGDFVTEMDIVLRLNYPTIVFSYGITFKPCSLFMDYLPMKNVQYYIDKAYNSQEFTEQELQYWNFSHKLIILLGISFGIEYLHSQDIVHRDLKPGNVLLDSKFYPRIGDFGLSKKLSNFEESMTANIRTPFFAAPEQLSSSTYNGKKADSYSFGMSAYSIFHDKLPFAGEGISNIIQLYKKLESGVRPKIEPEKVSESLEQLIIKCCDNDPEMRPDFKYISGELEKETQRIIQEKQINEEEVKEFFKFCKRKYQEKINITPKKRKSKSKESLKHIGTKGKKITTKSNSLKAKKFQKASSFESMTNSSASVSSVDSEGEIQNIDSFNEKSNNIDFKRTSVQNSLELSFEKSKSQINDNNSQQINNSLELSFEKSESQINSINSQEINNEKVSFEFECKNN